jgi:hypothetical protein
MKSLEAINFSWQAELTRVPDELFDLPNLSSLDFSGCWNLILSETQVNRIFDLAESGVSISILPLKFEMKSCRMKLSQIAKANGGEINWTHMKSALDDG